MTEHPQDRQPQQPEQPYYQPVPMTPADQRTWAIATHLSPFLASFVGGLSFLGPLILYIVFRDRGPFIRGRVIDVSTRAAEALGFKNAGVARVRVESQ